MLLLLNFREDLVKECIAKGTELVQAIANNLFNLPSTEDIEGTLVKLPAPTTRLPREKHVSDRSLIGCKAPSLLCLYHMEIWIL